MDKTHLIYKCKSPETLAEFMDKSEKLETIVHETFPANWKNPVFAYVYRKKLYHLNFDKLDWKFYPLKFDNLNTKLNKVIWDELESISMFINGYPQRTYNLVSLSYRKTEQEFMLGAIWWDGKRSLQDVYAELFPTKP